MSGSGAGGALRGMWRGRFGRTPHHASPHLALLYPSMAISGLANGGLAAPLAAPPTVPPAARMVGDPRPGQPCTTAGSASVHRCRVASLCGTRRPRAGRGRHSRALLCLQCAARSGLERTGVLLVPGQLWSSRDPAGRSPVCVRWFPPKAPPTADASVCRAEKPNEWSVHAEM